MTRSNAPTKLLTRLDFSCRVWDDYYMTNPIDHIPEIVEAVEQFDGGDIWKIHHVLTMMDVLTSDDDSNISAFVDAVWSMIATAHPDDITVMREKG